MRMVGDVTGGSGNGGGGVCFVDWGTEESCPHHHPVWLNTILNLCGATLLNRTTASLSGIGNAWNGEDFGMVLPFWTDWRFQEKSWFASLW